MEHKSGIIDLYKPSGITSHDAVFRVRRIFGIKRVGHAGTLDPMACGVLPVLLGSACAAQDIIMEHDKTYIAGIRFGIKTDTGDVTGNVIGTSDDIPDGETVKSVGESFVGKQMQVPPMYSAIKVGGKKLYELAREGKTAEVAPREITVYRARMLEKVSKTDYLFEFSVSKGTYIRTLAEDIGKKIGCGAALYFLERTVCGCYTKENAVTLEELAALSESGDEEALSKLICPPETTFADFPAVKLNDFYAKLAKNGCEIYLARAHVPESTFENGNRCRLYDENGSFFALGEVGDYENGRAVKAKIRFDIERK